MTNARNTQGEGEEGIEDIYDNMESLRDPPKALGTVISQQPDPVSPPMRPIKAVVVLLFLLSFALLFGLVRFAMQTMSA